MNIDRGAANTHIYWHGGKMLVLKEDSLPYHVDPYTLETLGRLALLALHGLREPRFGVRFLLTREAAAAA